MPTGEASSRPDGPGAPGAPRSRFVSGLGLERELSPRAKLDPNHVRQLAESLRAGAMLPPIVVEQGSSRVVDGFHRAEARRLVRGREDLIDAVEKDYAGEAELFEDAVRLNSAHGSRLAPYDHVRRAAVAQRLSIDPRTLAAALSVRPSYVGDLTARRTGTELTTRAPIPLKRTIEHMRGREITPAQIEANGKLGGQVQAFYIGQINLLAEVCGEFERFRLFIARRRSAEPHSAYTVHDYWRGFRG